LPSKERTRFHCQLFPGRFWRLPVTTCHRPFSTFSSPKRLCLSGAPLFFDGAISAKRSSAGRLQRERGFFCKAWPIFDFAAFSRNVYLIAIYLRACWRPWKISRLNQSHHPASGAGNNPVSPRACWTPGRAGRFECSNANAAIKLGPRKSEALVCFKRKDPAGGIR
jgi:hypothetical protein